MNPDVNRGRGPTDTQQVYEKWLSAIENDGVNLRAQFDKRGTLSEKQAEIIERIYAERTA